MSLHVLANHMASKGRDGDSMLVHMTPGEVHGLQALAMKHGGSLTINPDTGLPEANFLKSLLPMLAGFALNAFVPGLGAAVGGMFGASAAVGTGIAVGGITGLATGSLSKGLMAGLGAYGGAGLGESLMGAGAASGAGQALSVEAAKQAALEGITLPADYASLAAKTAMPEQIAAARAASTTGDLLSAGAKSAAADPMAFAKANFKPLAAAAAPIIADQMVPTTTQAPSPMAPGRIREKRWNGRYFEDVASTDAGVYNTSGRSFSDLYRGYNGGGIVALADGGAFENVVNAYDSANDNPAAAIAKIQAAMDRNKALAAQNLATAQAQPATAVDMASNKEATGIAALTPAANAASVTDTGAARELAFTSNNAGATPTGGLTNLFANAAGDIGNAVGTGTAAASQLTPTQAAAEVNDMYRNVLGRDADPVGMAYWTNQIAMGVPLDTLFNNFKTSATSNAEIVNQGVGNAAAAMKDYSGYTSTEGGTVGDEWVRNVLGRELNADDRSQQWYRDLLDPKIAKDVDSTKAIYNDFKAYAKSRDPLANTDLNLIAASQLKALPKTEAIAAINTALGTQTSDVGNTVTTDGTYRSGVPGASAVAATPKVGDVVGQGVYAGAGTPLSTGTVGPIVDFGGKAPFKDPATGRAISPLDLARENMASTAATKLAEENRLLERYRTEWSAWKAANPNATAREEANFIDRLGLSPEAVSRVTGRSPQEQKNIYYDAKYNTLTGDSKAAYDYLTGKGAYPTKSNVGQIARPYDEAVLGYPARGNLPYTYNKTTGKMDVNRDYVAPGRDASGNVTYGMSLNDIKQALKDAPLSGQALYDWAKSNKLSAQQISDATGQSLSSVYADFRAGAKAASAEGPTLTGDQTLPFADLYQSVLQREGDATGLAYWKSRFGDTVDADELAAFRAAAAAEIAARGLKTGAPTTTTTTTTNKAGGGMTGYALGGLGTLGGYSDGGRLLKGPGDGVSDSIPATIGRKQQPARLADGEFVIPARIVSELGNGSTDAGAKKLYAMMDRVQRARGKTTGKNKVAANSRADKYLPA